MLYAIMLCIIDYITFIFNSVFYTIMCMISINNKNMKKYTFSRNVINSYAHQIMDIKIICFCEMSSL